MKTHEYIIQVTADDIDALNHVNNVRYVQWVQDAAEAHWKAMATPEMKRNYLWVVLNHNISYKGQAFLNERIHVKTYVERSEGAVSTRIVEMSRDDNKKLLVKAETQWCLLDAQSKRPMRMDGELKALFQ